MASYGEITLYSVVERPEYRISHILCHDCRAPTVVLYILHVEYYILSRQYVVYTL